MPISEHNDNHQQSEKLGFLFMLFLIWTFVLLSRPQDIFTSLAPLRPAFVVSLVVLSVFMFHFIDSFIYPVSSFQKAIASIQTTLYTTLICIMIIGVPFAIYRRGAFLFVTDYIMKVALFYFIFTKMVDTIRKLEAAILLGSLGTGFYATMALTQGILKGQRLKFGGMFDPNDLAFFTLSFLPFNFLFISKENPLYQRVLSFISIISSVLVILMSGSRGGFLAFLVVIALLLMKGKYTVKFWKKVSALVLGCIAISFGIINIDFSRYKTILDIRDDYNITDDWGRVAVWKRGINYMLTNPLTGVGVSCFNMAIGEGRAKQGLKPKWQTAHNSFILVGAETGVIGFVLFLLMNLNAFKIFWRSGRHSDSQRLLRIGEMAKIGFVGQFICIIFLSQTYSLYWVFYIALSCVLYKFMQREDESNSINSPDPAILKSNHNFDRSVSYISSSHC